MSTTDTCDFTSSFDDLSRIARSSSLRILGDEARSDEIAQEALTRAFVRWPQVSGYAGPWVARVAKNLAIDEWRKRRPVDELRDDQLAEDDCSTDVLLRDDLSSMVRVLPRRQREAIVLRFLYGYSPAEAADVMGISSAGVLKHTTRGLSRLRRQVRAA